MRILFLEKLPLALGNGPGQLRQPTPNSNQAMFQVGQALSPSFLRRCATALQISGKIRKSLEIRAVQHLLNTPCQG